MRSFFLVLILTIATAPSWAQQRQDTFDAAAVTVTEIVLHPLPDGGCDARWCAEATSSDGGVTITSCTPEPVDLKAVANQNRCNALAAAGVNRVARRLNFDVDAGAP